MVRGTAGMVMSTKRKYVCTKCGHRAQWKQYGLFVCCPECGSDSIACAETWDRFGPGSAKKGELEQTDKVER